MDWKLDLPPGKPKYLALVDAIDAEVSSGRMREGDRLPPQRHIAEKTGVTIATVTRAIGEATRRGLVTARPGSGTFVNAAPATPDPPDGPHQIDLSLNSVPVKVAKPFLDQALRALSAAECSDLLFGYHQVPGLPRHRRAVAEWLQRRDLRIDPAAVMLTHGTQHGLAACFSALTRPGDVVACEAWTYTGIRRLAEAAGVTLRGVAMDGDGLRPDALAECLAQSGARILICSPAGQNPTAATMPLRRRQEVLAACARRGTVVVEDDIYGRLADALPPLAAMAPGEVIYLSSVSKCLAPGLRLGVASAPEPWRQRLQDALLTHAWVAPSFHAELFARMVEDGSAEACLAAHRQEARRRHGWALESLALPAADVASSYHLWLKLPSSRRIGDVLGGLAEAGVRVSPASHFAVEETSRDAPHVRIALGGQESDAVLRDGLLRVARTLAGTAHPITTIA